MRTHVIASFAHILFTTGFTGNGQVCPEALMFKKQISEVGPN